MRKRLFLFLGVLIIAVGLPFFLEKVGPNRVSGLRTEKTLSSPTIWYAANKVLGFDLIVAGVVVFLLSLVLSFAEKKNPDLPGTQLKTAVVIVSLCLAVIHSFWALGNM